MLQIETVEGVKYLPSDLQLPKKLNETENESSFSGSEESKRVTEIKLVKRGRADCRHSLRSLSWWVNCSRLGDTHCIYA